jgi:hypothetical protein
MLLPAFAESFGGSRVHLGDALSNKACVRCANQFLFISTRLQKQAFNAHEIKETVS